MADPTSHPSPTPTEVEVGAQAPGKLLPGWRSGGRLAPLAAAVLRAVLADHDARVRADERTRVAKEFADALRHYQPESAGIAVEHGPAMEHAAAIAELHATPPTTEEADHERCG